MGFSVTIDRSANEILKRLKANPTTIFDHPYKGYLLFLAGASDQNVLDWLKDNAIALDSLTGEEIAYIIFAKSFKVRLTCNTPFPIDRKPKEIGSIEADKINDGYAINRLVKSGKYGLVVDGDELTAITYAVDEVARQLGIVKELPCIVLLDAIPQTSVEFIHISDALLQVLFPLLRQTLGSFQNMDGYHNINKALNTFRSLQLQIDELERQKEIIAEQIKSIQNKIERIRPINSTLFHSLITDKIEEVESDLKSGSIRQFKRKVKQIPGIEKEFVSKLIAYLDFQKEDIISLNKIIYGLRFYLEEITWPLRDNMAVDYDKVYSLAKKYVDDLPQQTDHNDSESCSKVITKLQERRESIIAVVIDKIPDPEYLLKNMKQTAEENHKGRRVERETKIGLLEKRIEEIEQELNTLADKIDKSVAKYSKLALPSFSKAFKKTAKQYKINLYSKQAQNAVASFSGSLFKPETLLKIWSSFST